VFLNSHLLSEVEQVCDRVTIVDHGRVVASGTFAELLAGDTVRLRVTSLGEVDLSRFGRTDREGDWLTLRGIPSERIPDLVAEGLAMLTFGLALSTRLSGMVGGVIALVLFGMAWLGGIVGGIGTAFDNDLLERAGTTTKLILPTDGLWRGAVYALEPAAVLAGSLGAGPASAANPFYAAAPPPAAYLVWCALWLAAVLGAAIWSFSRREI